MYTLQEHCENNEEQGVDSRGVRMQEPSIESFLFLGNDFVTERVTVVETVAYTYSKNRREYHLCLQCSLDEALLRVRADIVERTCSPIKIEASDGTCYNRIDILRLTDIRDGSIVLLSPQNNPLWDEFVRIHYSSASEQRARQQGYRLARQYAWAITEPASVRWIARYLGPCAVEMGAGLGYWCWQLSQHGVDIFAYDIAPSREAVDLTQPLVYEEGQGYQIGWRVLFYPVQQGTPVILQQHEKRTLFLCYPPVHDPMAEECLRDYRGSTLVLIAPSGSTATPDFFLQLKSAWKKIDERRLPSLITPVSVEVFQRKF